MMIMPSELLIYPAAKIMREDINSGDKVILSVDILMACEHKQLTYPMAFSFTNQSNNKMVNAGVLEFTSPEHNHAYLPQWMFEHLQIQEGQYVNFEHVELPKGTFVQLQPVSSAWLVKYQ
jgi:ubiquitin fusion degradation protein 1